MIMGPVSYTHLDVYKRQGLADGEVLVDDRLIYTANDLKVDLFQDTSAF